MPPEDPTTIVADPAPPAATVPAAEPAVAAPRRDKRLVPTAPRAQPRRPAAAVLVPKGTAARPVPVSALETKVAATGDPLELLNLIRTEATLRRAQRLSGASDAQRQTIRLLSVFMLFALLVAAVGAMWYLQTSLQGSRRAHRPAVTTPAIQP